MSDAREATVGASMPESPSGQGNDEDVAAGFSAGDSDVPEAVEGTAQQQDPPNGDLGAERVGEGDEVDLQTLEQEGEVAADYIEGLLDIVDYDGDIDMDVEGDRAVVSVIGISGRELVGSRGEVLEALQDLTRLAVHQKTGARSRLMLDVGGYRNRRREELTKLGQRVAEEVTRTGQERSLEPMTPFERKVVHDAVAAAGLRSESEGEEPERYVVVLPS